MIYFHLTFFFLVKSHVGARVGKIPGSQVLNGQIGRVTSVGDSICFYIGQLIVQITYTKSTFYALVMERQLVQDILLGVLTFFFVFILLSSVVFTCKWIWLCTLENINTLVCSHI